MIRRILSHYSWDLAYGYYSENILSDGINWKDIRIVKNPYKTKWFADPFFLSASEDSIQLLVEEFDKNVNRGRIARIVIDRTSDRIIDCTIVLDLPTHLSFPAIYEIEGNIYVHPENSASGNSCIYRYDSQTNKLTNPIEVISAPIVDAIIDKDGNQFRMYATRTPNAGGNTLDIYESSEFLGTYVYKESINFQHKEARMAGAMIHTPNGIIRPAQDCNRDYGEAVIFYNGQEILSTIKPHSLKYEGLHTFNTHNNLFVIDLKKYDHYMLHRFIKNLKYRFI